MITAIDGEPTRTPEDFLAGLRARDPGQTATLRLRAPGGAERDVQVTLSDRAQVSTS